MAFRTIVIPNEDDSRYLREVLTGAQWPVPETWVSWWLDGCEHRLGWLPAGRLEQVARLFPRSMPIEHAGGQWIWRAAAYSAADRSAVIQAVAVSLRDSGLIGGWRSETYSCWGYRSDAWPYPEPELFRLERAAFRFFGLRSHAVHINGLTPESLMWCGRRSPGKATDPGRLDNLAAGGLSAGEEPEQCAIRELFEEAGLVRGDHQLARPWLEVLTEREEAEGWHSERLFIYNLDISADETPSNRDGEVSEFIALNGSQLMQRLKSGEFTIDAACAIAAFLVSNTI